VSSLKKILTALFLVVFLSALGLTGGRPQAAQAPSPSAALDQLIPVDPQVLSGRFTNGLRYFIRANKKPENRAELRLVVNAGSVLEDDDQRGLAHFVEHMSFNGTKHFAKQELVQFMESIGMRFGPSLNAYTSFDETIYMLQIPTDKPEVIKTAFLILEDWAHNLTFDPGEIDKERGVIVEEWRLGRGAGARMQDRQFPILLKGSRYAERLPIGRKEILESFKHEALVRFYRDWYRPDLMAVIAVGDFDKAAVEALIEQHFAALPAPSAPRLRPAYDVPDHPETLFAIAADKEAPTTMVSVYNKLPLRDSATLGAYRQSIVESLYIGMLNRRFSELAQKPEAPFLGGFSSRSPFVRSKEAAVLSAMVKEDGVERGLSGLLTESERVARFGFTPTEFERQKRDTLRRMEQMDAEKDKQESAAFADEYARHFLQREPIPGIAYEYELLKRFLPEIALPEINKLSREWTKEQSRVVMVSVPQKEGVPVPEASQLAGVIKAVSGSDLKPYVDTAGDQPLLEKIPEPGKIAKMTEKNEFGIIEWELANGVKVVLKPTDFKQDEIVFRALSPGGTSLASDEDFVPAGSAGQVISAGGLGKFNAIELRKILTGKVATVRPYISDIEEGLMGNASPKDLETMFQMIYLSFVEPRADAAIFGVLTTQLKAMLANRQASPEVAFIETLQSALSQNHFRARPLSPEIVNEWNLDKSFAFYKNRFADASDFTFIFVGNIDLEAMKPLVERYLGALPSIRRNESWKDVGIDPPKGVVQKVVKKGIEPKSQTAIVFAGPFQHNRLNRTAIRAAALVLDSRLRVLLREALSGTYSVAVNANYSKIPDEEYLFMINFGCDPDRAAELVKVVFREIESLKTNGPTEKEVSDVREAMTREFETNMKQNNYLLTQIYYRYQFQEDMSDLFTFADYLKTLNASMIQDAAKAYLKAGDYVQVSLFPEKESAVKKGADGSYGRTVLPVGLRRLMAWPYPPRSAP